MNELTTKSVSELVNYQFYIPNYQRRYKWEPKQVESLLDDIDSFTPVPIEKTGQTSWYCIQPLVVKNIGQTADGKMIFEVIDGQQRLTTLMIIFSYLNDGSPERRKRKIYDFDYETRKESIDFLKNIASRKSQQPNIDFHYMGLAYDTVKKWMENSNIDESKIMSKLWGDTKFIWYQVMEGINSMEVFTRLNLGKIPLTNAELVKAALLNGSNFSLGEAGELKKHEIASDWNNIEKELNNDEFWYFLKPKSNEETRMELILRIAIKNETTKDLLLEYISILNQNKKHAIKLSQQIMFTFELLKEWYSDKTLYHLVGLNLQVGASIYSMVEDYKNGNKTTFKNKLSSKIMNYVELESMEWVELNYLSNKKEINNLLLIYNVAKSQNSPNNQERFSFSKYNTEKWDLEHINSTTEKSNWSETEKADWIRSLKAYVPKNILKNIEGFEQGQNYEQIPNEKEFEKLLNDVLSYFNRGIKDNNNILNICLLDRNTNRSYKNNIFPTKRRKLIQAELNGKYIPLGTKHIFMKYYTGNTDQLHFWDASDAERYKEDIIETLNVFFTSFPEPQN